MFRVVPIGGVLTSVLALSGCGSPALIPQSEAPWPVEARLDGPVQMSPEGGTFTLTVVNGADVPVCLSFFDEERYVSLYDAETGRPITLAQEPPSTPRRYIDLTPPPPLVETVIAVEPGGSRVFAYRSGPAADLASDFIVVRDGSALPVGPSIELEAEVGLSTYPCTFPSSAAAYEAGETHRVVSNRSRPFTTG